MDAQDRARFDALEAKVDAVLRQLGADRLLLNRADLEAEKRAEAVRMEREVEKKYVPRRANG